MNGDTLALLERLIGFPSISRDSNLPLIEFLESYLAGFGIPATRVPSPCGQKASLYASIGPRVAGGVILSGHTDVVPVEGQDWHSDPWRLTRREGRLIGRGTCDMKGFLAVVLGLLPRMIAAGLRRPIHLALSHDEELGCAGADALVREMMRHLPPVAGVIVGEPTMMRVVSAHKGMLGFRTVLRGHPTHSSLINQGVSAVMCAADLIAWHNRRNEENAFRLPPAQAAGGFDVPFTSLHVGMIEGGNAINTTAHHCAFTSEIRPLPGEDAFWRAAYLAKAAEISDRMRRRHRDCGLEVTQVIDVPSLAPAPPALPGLSFGFLDLSTTEAVSYASEGGFFQRAGLATIVCGPGSIAQAHQPDEFITLDELHRGESFIAEVIRALTV
ncbi:acetylornithine deacetylase [Paracoccus aminophilus]|uniref:Acetylornithine deacetylase n=1 Tax=Paracoccus aminophilus JCM 7686 TaxID=1367847 RepID=S5XZC4_PARAH|nr:acetylornithine deacetylase [Paracoccus aminophilus]AGT08805.1 acetylornithine deacetylase [Paracoccus aminophilus JCM 7686]